MEITLSANSIHYQEIIKSYDDSRIRYIPCRHDFIATRNKGKRLAQGKYIAQFDHDDIMIPDRLRIQYDFMESHPDIAACGGHMQCFGKYTYVWRYELDHETLLPLTILQTPIHNPTGFIRREVLVKHHIRHRRGYSFAEDFKFWTDIIKVGRIANIPEILVRYRTSDDQASNKYCKESFAGSNKIQCEMIEYFLSLIDSDDPMGQSVLNQLMPAVQQMGESGFFSGRVFYSFMHEMIRGLIQTGVIKICYD